jgi:NitT/TauT family transport system permease protein
MGGTRSSRNSEADREGELADRGPARLARSLGESKIEGASQRLAVSQGLVWFLRVVVFVVFIAGWELSVRRQVVAEFFVSRPSAVLAFLGEFLRSGDLVRHGSVTAAETLAGFAVGSAAGIISGLLIARLSLLEAVVSPYLAALNALPRVALAPMFILWFGIGPVSKVYLAVSLVFFVLLLNTQAGIRSVDSDLLTTARVLGATEVQMFTKVILPGAVPAIFAGLRLGAIYALLGVVVGEMIAAISGLGQQLSYFSGSFLPAGVFGVLFLLAMFAVLLDKSMQLVERRLLRWQTTESESMRRW